MGRCLCDDDEVVEGVRSQNPGGKKRTTKTRRHKEKQIVVTTAQLRKFEEDYDPTDRLSALQRLEIARQKGEFITGLIYIDKIRPSLAELNNLGDTPLVHLPDEKLRPARDALEKIMDSFL